jgi:glycosyltransferase involved in cell wall biosynthesis
MIEGLHLKGHQVRLCIYGEGIERKLLENYIETKQLASIVFFKEIKIEIIQKAYQESHFVILPSIEGFKAIAEGMFWDVFLLQSFLYSFYARLWKSRVTMTMDQ